MEFKTKKHLLMLIGLVAILTVACSGSGSSDSQGENTETEQEDECSKGSAEDFDNFLGIEYGMKEGQLEKILGKSTGKEYTADSLAFMYYFKSLENAPITVWVNSKSHKVETIFMEVLSYEEYFENDLDEAVEEYSIQECDSRFFGMKKNEVTKIMGEPDASETLEDGVKSISYDSKDFKYAVNFKFYPEQADMCSSISVNWFY